MNVFGFVVRRHAFAAFAFGLAAIAGAPAIARGRHLCARRREFQTGHHRGDPICGRRDRRQDQRRRLRGLRPLDLPAAAQSDQLSRKNRQSGRRARHQRLEDVSGAIRADRPGAAPGPRPRHGAVPAVGHRDRRTGRRTAIFDRRGQRAPRRPHDRRRRVLARHRAKRASSTSRVVFVDETGPKEKRRKRLAIMDMDGANVKYLDNGNDLVVTPRFSPSAQQLAYMSFGAGRSQGDAAQSRDRTARVGRQFSRHDLRAALFAGRTGDRDVALRRRKHQSLLDGPALARNHAPHRGFGDRHFADLFARRLADRV